VIPAVVRRVGWARHAWLAFDAVYPDPSRPKEEDWLRMTREVMAHFDRAVREAPDQYFWFNKRWVLDPLPP
jgi:lauroyl/myristoyl acyltransferase